MHIGSFIFINQGYGNLSCIYQNNEVTEPYPEAAKKRKGEDYNPNVFEGIYDTVWLELNNNVVKHVRAELIITPNNDTYNLVWNDSKGKKIFEGIGWLQDGKLLGSYQDV